MLNLKLKVTTRAIREEKKKNGNLTTQYERATNQLSHRKSIKSRVRFNVNRKILNWYSLWFIDWRLHNYIIIHNNWERPDASLRSLAFIMIDSSRCLSTLHTSKCATLCNAMNVWSVPESNNRKNTSLWVIKSKANSHERDSKWHAFYCILFRPRVGGSRSKVLYPAERQHKYSWPANINYKN